MSIESTNLLIVQKNSILVEAFAGLTDVNDGFYSWLTIL